MMTYESKVAIILYCLWRSAEYESDFEIAWADVYDKFKQGAYFLPEPIISMVYQWTEEWEDKNYLIGD